ncbi:MAG: PQQ-binding-like beta-propeller repeat protein [Verrucomicrobia bacterium]|nr:PQQ-binding-like beta-propeller repeat protein [Verrucomicrobiota bacterium]
MKRTLASPVIPWVPGAVALLAVTVVVVWLWRAPRVVLQLRVPGTDQAPGTAEGGAKANPVLSGKLILADGRPADLSGSWPRFRGPNLDGISDDPTPLAKAWEPSGPKPLWSKDVGEGYAGAAVERGRVYVMDYDLEKRQDALRCLSLADGKEIWRYAYPLPVKRNHGMSRTVPAITEKFVVAMGPKCHVVCLDAASGELRWTLDLVRDHGATVPPWYAGQCPLIDNGRAILAVGGEEALILAVEIESGRVVWKAPNPKKWKMTHSSVVPMEFEGQRTYVYCANQGVAGISAKDGTLFWETSDWKISIATIPSPVILDEGRIFLSGGYDAGSLMLQLQKEAERIVPRTLFKLEPRVFGATQHTPAYYAGHIYGIRPDGQLVCLALDGKVLWSSGPNLTFGLGPFLISNGLLFAMNDSGKLTLAEASPLKFTKLAEAQILHGRESWGPLALAGGRLIARDFTRMVCLDVAAR